MGRIFFINLTLILYNFDIISIKILMVMGITTDKAPHSLSFPYLSGFYSKDLILELIYDKYYIVFAY